MFQFWMWFFVGVFTFMAVWAARSLAYMATAPPGSGLVPSAPDVPLNLFIAMGFSVTTFVAARAITSTQASTRQLAKGKPSGGGILVGDNGLVDLAKAQLVVWTILGILVYFSTVIFTLLHTAASSLGLPDIDAALMLLMGLGHGAYLGNKLVLATGSISGKVLDGTNNNAPLQNVTIQVQDANNNTVGAGFSDTNGTYSIGGIPPGPYTVRFTLASYTTVTKSNVQVANSSLTVIQDTTMTVAPP
jgi:hypothetical protein